MEGGGTCPNEKWPGSPGLPRIKLDLQEGTHRQSSRAQRESQPDERAPWDTSPARVGAGTGADLAEQTHLATSSAPPTAEG